MRCFALSLVLLLVSRFAIAQPQPAATEPQPLTDVLRTKLNDSFADDERLKVVKIIAVELGPMGVVRIKGDFGNVPPEDVRKEVETVVNTLIMRKQLDWPADVIPVVVLPDDPQPSPAPPMVPQPPKPPGDIKKTPLEALDDSFAERLGLKDVTLISAERTTEGTVVLVGTRPESVSTEEVEIAATEILKDYNNLDALAGNFPPDADIPVDASRLIVADMTTTAGVVSTLDRLAAGVAVDEKKGQRLLVQSYDPRSKSVQLTGYAANPAVLESTRTRLVKLDHIDRVETGAVIVAGTVRRPPPAGMMSVWDAFGNGSGPALVRAAEYQIVTEVATPETWQFRAIGHLWTGNRAEAVGDLRMARSLGATELVAPERFQGPQRIEYERLWELGPEATYTVAVDSVPPAIAPPAPEAMVLPAAYCCEPWPVVWAAPVCPAPAWGWGYPAFWHAPYHPPVYWGWGSGWAWGGWYGCGW